MKKSAPLAFRIPDELKKNLRSIYQIHEILLTIGTEVYAKEGPRYCRVSQAPQMRFEPTGLNPGGKFRRAGLSSPIIDDVPELRVQVTKSICSRAATDPQIPSLLQ